MIIEIILALIVAIIWSIGEIEYSKISKKEDSYNVYFYQYFIRTIIYILVVLIFKINIIGKFVLNDFIRLLPIILCDLFGSYVLNKSVKNGELSSVSPIMAAYPVIDILLGLFLLGEKVNTIELILVVLISISIIVLATGTEKTSYAPHPLIGILFAIVYMFLIAFSTFFEKNAYINNLSIYDLYYYKGMVYLITSIIFLLLIFIKKKKFKKINLNMIKGSAITPVGNVFYSFALNYGNIMIVTPISSIYSVITSIASGKVLKEKITLKEGICITLILVSTILLIILNMVK